MIKILQTPGTHRTTFGNLSPGDWFINELGAFGHKLAPAGSERNVVLFVNGHKDMVTAKYDGHEYVLPIKIPNVTVDMTQ